MKLTEYIVHPLHALRTVADYDRNPEIRRAFSKDKRISSANKSGKAWMREYFDSMYDFNRIQLYATYKEIGQDPLIISVLDSYAAACSQINSTTTGVESGRTVWCFSNNKDIETLVYRALDRLDIDELAYSILRTMFHNGDHYEYMPGIAGEGIPRLSPYEAWEVAMIKDGEGKIAGYTQSDTKGEPSNMDTVTPFYNFAHFMMPNRQRTELYGAKSGLLFNIREYWQELQWCWDKILIERLRRADRTIITLDVGGMSTEDAFFACMEWQDRLYQSLYANTSTGDMQTAPPAWGEQRDIVIPSFGDNKTGLSHTQSSSIQSMEDAKMLLARLFAALKFPAGYLGLDVGGSYDKGESLAKQDVAFATNCTKPQRSFLNTLAKIISYDLAWKNIDVSNPKNYFILMASPVSNYQEIEKKEVLGLRLDMMDKAFRAGEDYGWNKKFWTEHVMKEYGNFSPEMVEELLKKDLEEEKVGNETGGGTSFPFEGDASSYKEALLEGHPRKKYLAELLYDGNYPSVCSNLGIDFSGMKEDKTILEHENADYVYNLVIDRVKKRQKFLKGNI